MTLHHAKNSTLKISFLFASAFWINLIHINSLYAGTISDTPLFLATQTIPNIFFELDDSGSMDWTILAKNYFDPCAYDPNVGNYNNSSADCGTTILTRGDMHSYGTTP